MSLSPTPKIFFSTLESCAEATGIVVAIDVIRAFTTAAYAFAAGAERILPVGTVEEALMLRWQLPGSVLVGEQFAIMPDGFNFGNSPSALIGQDLRGCTLIQRTSAGTQGLVRSVQARHLLASSFVCAGPTARAIQELLSSGLDTQPVTLVSTGPNDEDPPCAEYIAALLQGQSPDTASLLLRARQAGVEDAARMLRVGRFNQSQYISYLEDLELCLEVDRFDFAMRTERKDGRLVLRPHPAETDR